MKTRVRGEYLRGLVVGTMLLVSTAAFAASPKGTQEPVMAPEGLVMDASLRSTETRTLELTPVVPGSDGMRFDLPSSAKGAKEVTLAVLAGVRVVARETVVLPDALPATPTVTFLSQYPKELAQIRRLDAANHGALRFTVSAGEQILVNVAFQEADGGSVGTNAAVGVSSKIEMKIPRPRIATDGMEPDPECEQACHDTYVDCYYNICDQRGNCSYCWTDYQYCAESCPQICVEPKSVSTVTTSWTQIGSYNHGQICVNGYAYLLIEMVDRRYVYQRTTHCDNSYTDVLQETQYRSRWCKYPLGPGCFGNFYNPPPTC
ncbi:MAG TPA: hypothetical protein VF618_22545 [Thermoanaerobaculia bacterium]